jgi:type IV secretory pathway TraG/TraD family ATPase VirD4
VAALDAHARSLWGGTIAVAAVAVWGGVLRGRLMRSYRPAGRARFACGAELRRLTRRSPGAWFPLGYAPGWRLPALGSVRKCPVWLPEQDLARHVLVLGLTGAHKTTAVTIPVLLEAARNGVSVVALDLKYGEEDSLARVAPEWWRCGRDVLVFAPLDSLSQRWNPLSSCTTMGDAHRLATQLFDDVDAGDPDMVYWIGAERHVCAALSFALATDGGPPTLERLRALCEAGPAAVHAYAQGHPASPVLATHLGAYRAMLPKDEAGILQGIASRLEAWGDEAVCRSTGAGPAWDRIDLDRLRREPVLLLVGVPQPALSRLRWLCHLFLRDLAAHLLRPRGQDERVRVLQILEELPAWGPLPGMADHLATFRSRGVSVLATIQSESQGEAVYGRDGWGAIAANLVTKIYLPSLADPDAERLSRALGTASAWDVARSQAWGPGGRSGGEHAREIPVPLRRPEELRGTDAEHQILVRSPALPPLQLWCPPFYLRRECRGRVPHVPPQTADLAVRHHLWYRRAWGGVAAAPETDPPTPTAGSAGARAPAGTDAVAIPAALRSVPPQALDGPHAGDSDGGPTPAAAGPDRQAALSPTPTTDDTRALERFVERLVGAADGGSAPSVRYVRRGGRLAEVWVDPAEALKLCGDPDAVPVLLRRWAALRWVRRVRPWFTVERRAIEALGAETKRRLMEREKKTVSARR